VVVRVSVPCGSEGVSACESPLSASVRDRAKSWIYRFTLCVREMERESIPALWQAVAELVQDKIAEPFAAVAQKP
jgi:hypothetical protein